MEIRVLVGISILNLSPKEAKNGKTNILFYEQAKQMAISVNRYVQFNNDRDLVAARLDPTYQLNLGRFYKMAGDNPRARAAFEAFLAARSSSAEYRQVIPQVRKELESLQ